MRRQLMSALVAGATLISANAVLAEPAQAPPAPAPSLDDIPDTMPFATPYGPAITLEHAEAAVDAARAEAQKRGWAVTIAVVDSAANLVSLERMDGANIASAAIARKKAETSVKFRRPTKLFEEAIQKKGFNYLIAFEDILPSRGGIPLVANGHVIGAIGCSGGTGSQDEAVCLVGAAVVGNSGE